MTQSLFIALLALVALVFSLASHVQLEDQQGHSRSSPVRVDLHFERVVYALFFVAFMLYLIRN
jgi:hypothetical protein